MVIVKPLTLIKFEHSGNITKACPYNVYPLEPHFYIAKLGYAGVYLFFLFLIQNKDCGYSLEPPNGSPTVLTSTHNPCFGAKIKKIKKKLMKIFIFDNFKNLCILHRHVFIMSHMGMLSGFLDVRGECVDANSCFIERINSCVWHRQKFF